MKRLAACCAVLLCLQPGLAQAQRHTFTTTITGGKEDSKNVPVRLPLSLPRGVAGDLHPYCKELGFGQLTAPGITTEHVKPSADNLVRRDLHFVLTELKAGKTITLRWSIPPHEDVKFGKWFQWNDERPQTGELFFVREINDRVRVLRYMHAAYDNSTPAKRNETYKVFHHLYDSDGKRVTNGGQADGPVPDEKKLLYPHHRGLMYAFNKISYGKTTGIDAWHAKPGETHQSHGGFVRAEHGPVLGRHRVLVDWHGGQGEVFAKEERELTTYNIAGGTLVEFASRLRTAVGKLKLAGDPQHAGFQFRAHNDVAEKTKKETYYLRPDGKGKPGDTRNWDPKTKKGPVNLPWNAMSFVLDGKRYTVTYLTHPSNPGETRWSERDYGRFGCYFEHEVTENQPLIVNYRIWLQNGEMTVPEVAALYRHFAEPPAVSVK